MKKKKLIIAGLAMSVLLGLAACKAEPKDIIDLPPVIEEDTCEIVFNTNGGTSVLTQWISVGKEVAKPSDPKKDGYEFMGWFLDKDCTAPFDFSTKVSSHLILYAKWEEIGELFYLSFDTNGHGKVPNTVEVNKIKDLPILTETGYKFLGWYFEEDFKTQVLVGDEITENKTVYAKWELQKYVVSFNSNGGTPIANQIVEYGKHCPRPANPTRDNYNFAGWYKDEQFTLPCDFVNGVIMSNLTCYAKWSPKSTDPNSLTVEFNSKLGSKVDSITGIVAGTKIAKPIDPTRQGYNFVGWFKTTDGELTEEFNFETEEITESMILFAKWDPKDIKVTLKDSVTDSLIEEVTGKYEQFLTVPSDPEVKSGYRFLGWSTKRTSFEEFNFSSLITEEIVLYAYYEAVDPDATVEVKFVSYGTNIFKTDVLNVNEFVIEPAIKPTREGYLFSGWSTSASSYIPFDFTTTRITKDTFIYAYWVKVDDDVEEEFTVTFYSFNGNVFKTEKVKKNTILTEPATEPTRAEYTFGGWYMDEELFTKYNFSNPVVKDLELYAKWNEQASSTQTVTSLDFVKFNSLTAGKLDANLKTTAAITVDKFTVGSGVKCDDTMINTQGTRTISFKLTGTVTNSIKFVGSGASSTKTSSVTLLKNNGSKYETIKTLGSLTNAKVLDITESNLVAGDYQIQTSASVKITELTLTEISGAIAPATFTVQFDSQGGSSVTAQKVENGQKAQEPTVPSKEGYEFLGWYKEAACLNKYDFTAAIEGDMTLYAKWEEEAIPPDVTTYTVSFVTNCDTTIADKIVVEGRKVVEPAKLTKEDHTFGGWYKEAACINVYDFATPVTGNLTLYAKWTEIVTYTVTFDINGYGDKPNDLTKIVELPELPKLISTEKSFGGWYYDKNCSERAFQGDLLEGNITLYAKWNEKSSLEIIRAEGHLETAYIEWKELDGIKNYNVYYKKLGETDGKYVALDKMLIREYADKYRADVLGLAAGKYTLKVAPVIGNDEDNNAALEDVVVSAHDRSGFGFSSESPLKTSSGAYNSDGTLRSGAQVIYVTAKNAKTVTAQITVSKSGPTTVTGLQAILDAKQKATATEILDIRLIGEIKKTDLDKISSSAEGLQIKGNKAYSDMGITIEGVGEDATVNGFGFLIRNCGNLEMRNFGIVNFMDDGVSIDTTNCNLWIHNLDIFYGNAGGDSDQAKGDGSLDIKKSQYITVSYNHFWDSGKCCLLDASAASSGGSNQISYHHNWFDHSDSRHPRVRNASAVHVYNNYFDGNSKYGIGASVGGSIFSENNFFRNVKYPMLTSKQGSDMLDGKGVFSGENGGFIKAFGNVIVGGTFTPYSSNVPVEFDAYVATTKEEVVSSSITSKQGGQAYSNFDTKAGMYSYQLHDANDIPALLSKFAGRINGGDLKWTFNNSVEDTNYGIIAELKSMVVNYKTTLVRVLGE